MLDKCKEISCTVSTGITDSEGNMLHIGDKVKFYAIFSKLCTRHTPRKMKKRNRQTPPFYLVAFPVEKTGIITINDTPSYEFDSSWDGRYAVVTESNRPSGPFIIRSYEGWEAYDLDVNFDKLARYGSDTYYNWPGISRNLEKYKKITKI